MGRLAVVAVSEQDFILLLFLKYGLADPRTWCCSSFSQFWGNFPTTETPVVAACEMLFPR